jgi:hypothetical protein
VLELRFRVLQGMAGGIVCKGERETVHTRMTQDDLRRGPTVSRQAARSRACSINHVNSDHDNAAASWVSLPMNQAHYQECRGEQRTTGVREGQRVSVRVTPCSRV